MKKITTIIATKVKMYANSALFIRLCLMMKSHAPVFNEIFTHIYIQRRQK